MSGTTPGPSTPPSGPLSVPPPAFPAPGAATAAPRRRSPYAEAAARLGQQRTEGSVPAGAHHKPGAVPLRPLGVGDLFDAALAVIRHNPGATLGASLVVSAFALFVPLLVVTLTTTVLGAALGDAEGLRTGSAREISALVGSGTVAVAETAVLLLGTVFLTGVVAHVVLAAAVGELVDVEEAWARLRGRRWALLGLTLLLAVAGTLAIGLYVLSVVLVVLADVTLLLVLYMVVTVPLGLLALAWLAVRFAYLAPAVLVLERVSVLRALRRASSLTRRSFWRTLGIVLLTQVVSFLAITMLSFPFAIVEEVAPSLLGEAGDWVALASLAVSSVLVTALVTPFLAGVCACQYLDLRIRREAYDVELLTRSTRRPAGGAR